MPTTTALIVAFIASLLAGNDLGWRLHRWVSYRFGPRLLLLAVLVCVVGGPLFGAAFAALLRLAPPFRRPPLDSLVQALMIFAIITLWIAAWGLLNNGGVLRGFGAPPGPPDGGRIPDRPIHPRRRKR